MKDTTRIWVYHTTEGYGLEYWAGDGLHTIATGLEGLANTVMTAKKWVKEQGIDRADILEPFGVIWEIRGKSVKRFAPNN